MLNANVQEQATGELQLSAGFSSLESFILQGSIQQRNFRGRGQTVGASVNWSRYSRSATLSFTEPYVFDRNVSMGLDIYRRNSNNSNYYSNNSKTYDQTTTGFQVRAGVPITENASLIGRYTLNFDDVALDKATYYSTRQNPGGDPQCDPLLAGRYLCEAIGNRVSSIVGTSLVYDTLDNRIRPTRGETMNVSLDVAGAGGTERYAKLRATAAKYWPLGSGWIFSVSAEGGYIKGLGQDVRLTDRFFLGDPQIRGFDIRGVGPRILRKYYTFDTAGEPIKDTNGDYVLYSDPKNPVDDPLGGQAYYLAHTELEIPLGSGARELGLRPSIFVDVGSVFSVKQPTLTDTSPYYCTGVCQDGQVVYRQYPNPADTTVYTDTTVVPTTGTAGVDYVALGTKQQGFREIFLGDSPKPRISVGIGVNWNSPFGPFRIDFAKVLMKQPGDDPKSFTFNVGTQF